MTEEKAYWLAWTQISGIGPILMQKIQRKFNNLQTAWKASPEELAQVPGLGTQTIQKIVQQRAKIDPETLLTQHQEKNPYFWTPGEPHYPRLLLEIPNPPSILYYSGQVEPSENLGEKPVVGIVGTREPSDYGIRWTRKITTALAKNGFTVVSGLANGIDTETHQAALQAGGRTILGTGVDVIYPQKNRQLYHQILKQGLIMSEYPANTPPDRGHFPSRNRIIAGLSRAVLVMEAPLKSGALITATYANEFGRDVYALPGRVDDNPSEGCLKLLSQGASFILRELEELLKMLGAIPKIDTDNKIEEIQPFSAINTPPVVSTPLPQLSPELQQVINVILGDALSFDMIVQKTGMNTSTVSSALLQLELLGLVSQLPGMRYQRN